MKRLFLVLAAASLLFSSNAMAKEEVMINGSTTLLPIIQKASEVFMQNNPSVALSISGGGSGNGIKALNEGLCQIAMSSRDVKSSELADAKSKGIELNRITIAWDALVPVVHPSNKVQELSLEQLKNIYTGKITNWKELGGDDEKIVVISRDTSSGTFESWAELVMNKEKVAPTALLQASSGAVVTTVSKNKRAIGYIGFGYVNKTLKVITVDGVKASAESVLQKKWEISRELYLFTNGAPKGAAKEFVDFMLDAKKGQNIVQETGFIRL